MKKSEGGCRCKSVRYAIDGEAQLTAICHCDDCRRSSGAPFVAWAAVKAEAFRLTQGKPKRWTIDGNALRFFCEKCGTGLYYINDEKLPGLVDVQVSTLDNPNEWPPELQMQVAEELSWAGTALNTPSYQRYPDPFGGVIPGA